MAGARRAMADFRGAVEEARQSMRRLALEGREGNNDEGVPVYHCCSCEDPFAEDKCVQLPCRHMYCFDCLGQLFKTAMSYAAAYPPRCCGFAVPLEAVARVLDAQLVRDFREKKEELEDDDKVYCAVPTCSKYIGHAYRSKGLATCPKCEKNTCLYCRQPAHSGTCPRNKEKERVLELAEAKEWKVCPHCKDLVELGDGCWTITCKCGKQFCYHCGEKADDCPCYDHPNPAGEPSDEGENE